MKESKQNKVGNHDKEKQHVQPSASNFSIKKVLDTAKSAVMIPTYFLLMSALKVLDKKDRIQKKERKGYYF